MRKPSGYWTYEKCKEVALKCKTKSEFLKKYKGAYLKTIKNKWMDDFSKHMIPLGNKYRRMIYCYLFSDNCVYIGLTHDIKRRHRYHLNNEKSKVYQHILESNRLPNMHYLTNNFIDVNEAQLLEKYWINEYRKNGWNVLNTTIGGELGGSKIYWTKEMCEKEALKYDNRNDFAKNSVSAYISARKNQCLNDVCKHMKTQKKPSGYWSYKKCKEAASKCKTRFEFSRKYSRAYNLSVKNDWLKDFDMKKAYHTYTIWNYDVCKNLASNCVRRSDFYKKHSGAYNASIRNKWINDFFPNTK